MNKLLNKVIKSSILSSLALIILAVLLIVQSEMTIIVISYIIGALLIALGVLAELNFVKNINNSDMDFNLIYGVVCVILGIIVISNPEAIAEIVPLVLGFIIVVSSAIKMQYSIELKRQNNKLWISTLLLSILMTICGVVLIINPFQGALFLTRIVGIFVLVYAIMDFIASLTIRKTFNKLKKDMKETIKEADIIEDKDLIEENESKRRKKDE